MGVLEDNTQLIFVSIGRISAIAIFRLESSGANEPVLEFESMYGAGTINQPFSVLLQNI